MRAFTGHRQSVAVVALLAVSAWLVYRDSTFDTFRTPLFWPFLFSTGLTVALSTSAIADDQRGWQALVVRVAAGAGLVAGGAAWLASRNPINGIGVADVLVLAIAAAANVAVAGAATAWARQPDTPGWLRTAACLAAVLLMLWITPRLILALHAFAS